MEEIYQRTKLLLGENLDKIRKASVCICGIGGVGSYTLEALARIGVGNITIIDKDDIDITNINRQLIATVDNVGKPKVEAALTRINSINPEIKIKAIKQCINDENICKYIKHYDYVIDAIDSIDSKIALIKHCKQNNIRIISSMGMANRIEPLKIKVADISKTQMCPLAKIVRKRLKEEKIYGLKVVYSIEEPIKTATKTLGSVSFVPSVAGLVIASEVVKDLIKR